MYLTALITHITEIFRYVLFADIFGFPFLVLWLLIGSIFFTIRLNFVSIRLFVHAIRVVKGHFSSDEAEGEASHLQALIAAISGTVGVGNIAGVAVAIAMGGPGALLWMIVAGLLGMATKFAEVTLGHKYRIKDDKRHFLGGPFIYLEKGIASLGWPRFGKILAITFSICCIGAAIGGVNMLQANQTVLILSHGFSLLKGKETYIALFLAFCNGLVLIGGIKRIVQVAQAIVPLMTILFLAGAIIIIITHFSALPYALKLICTDAFSGQCVGGGIMGALIAGVRRAAYSSESGLGSSPIVHATAKTEESVREGCVALLETFISTSVICLLSGLTIVISGVHSDSSLPSGILMSRAAFASVTPWFPYVLTIAVTLFAYTTMMTWSYYGERSWVYLWGSKYVQLYYIVFCVTTFLGGVSPFSALIDFSDMLMYSMTLPNLLGLYLLHNDVAHDMKIYQKKLKEGFFLTKK